jgi:hypothetical protein
MNGIYRQMIVAVRCLCVLTLVPALLSAQQLNGCAEQVSAQVHVDSGHPWRPPFGLDRVGGPLSVRIDLRTEQSPLREYYVTAYRNGRELGRQSLNLRQNPAEGQAKVLIKGKPPYFDTAQLQSPPEEVALYARCPGRPTRKRF